MVKIALGTTSIDKENFLKEVFGDSEIFRIAADSEISDQPLSKEETVRGAKNRAKNAFSKEFDFAVGMEGGLEFRGGIYHLVCAVSIFDGLRFFTGVSFGRELPEVVSKAVENGGEFGELIRDFACKNPDENVEEIISRRSFFIDAVRKALANFEKGEYDL